MRSAAAGLILAAVTASASPDVPTASASQSEAQTVSEVAAVSGATFNLSEVRAMHFREDTGIEGVSRLEASTTIGPDDFVFAVEETDRNESYIRMLASLAEGLRVAFPDRRTHIRQIPSRGFIDVVRAEKIPFVFATAGTMVALVNESGAVPLAARERLNTHAEESSQSAAGGLLVVDAKRRDLGSLESLEGARIAVESSVAFGPWQWLAGRLLADHHDPRKFFSEAVWRPHDVPEVLNAVLSGRADAGLISVCTFEALAAEGMIDPKAFRPAAVLKRTPGACLSSTPLYPDWTLGYMAWADGNQVRRVAAVAFSLPENDGWRWGLRVDLSSVRSLMEALHFGPYSYLDEQAVAGFMKSHAEWFAALVAVFLFVLFHALRSRYLVRVKTQALRTALEEKERMENEARVSREQLSAIERAGMLSQMSSMFAHELKQPLSSLSNYVGGLKLWNAHRQTNDADRALADDALSAMAEEANRITAIVNRVRGYAKASTEPLKPTDWTAVVRRAELIVERHDARRVPIYTAPGQYLAADPEDDRPAWVLGDALELELLVLNFIRNAAHAAQKNPKGFVSVSLAREGDNYVLHVTDNGPKLSPEGFARLTGYGDSVKQEGMGIGLSICRGIADRHGGQLKFYQLPTEGVCAEAVIEAAEPPEGTHETDKGSSQSSSAAAEKGKGGVQ